MKKVINNKLRAKVMSMNAFLNLARQIVGKDQPVSVTAYRNYNGIEPIKTIYSAWCVSYEGHYEGTSMVETLLKLEEGINSIRQSKP